MILTVSSATADSLPPMRPVRIGRQLKLSSNMVGQSVDVLLSLSQGQETESDFFGLARISLHPSLTQPSSPRADETRVVFAHYAPISHAESPSDVIVGLSEDGSKVTILSGEGSGGTYLRSEIMNRPVTEASAIVVVESYWPDFVMKAGRPETKSQSPNNPAALVRISKLSQQGDAKPSLQLAPAEDGIAYQLGAANSDRQRKSEGARVICARLGRLASRGGAISHQRRIDH
jgi:hypothetical protein